MIRFLLLTFCTLFLLPSFLSAREFNGRPYNIATDKVLDKFAYELAEKYGFHYFSTENGCISEKAILWNISLISAHEYSLDKLRPIVVSMMEDYLAKTKEAPVFLDQLIQMNCRHWPQILDYEKIGLKLAFWDKDVNRPKKPYIAQIKVINGIINYYYADPITQALTESVTETIDEAKALLNKEKVE